MPRDSSPLRDRVIFLVGARRSGTNWLERILTAHPEVVAVPTETYLFSDGIQPLSERFQHANPAAPTMGRVYLPRDVFLDAARDLVDSVFAQTLRNDGPARYVVERTPWHASHLPLIAEVYPDARVLNIIRDGRAVARSMLSMPWAVGPRTMTEAATEWRTAVLDARAGGRLFGDRYREVVYESMLRDPRPAIAAVFEWLSLELDDATWSRILDEAGAEFNVDTASPGIGVDKWRHETSAADLAEFERVAGDQLDALGYPRAAQATPAPVTRPLVGRARQALSRVRHPRRRRAATLRRRRAREMHADQIAHNELVSVFENALATGDTATVRELSAPTVRVRILGDDVQHDSRGEPGLAALLSDVAAHRARGLEVVAGTVHVTAYGVTTVAQYTLDDRTRWTRTVAYETLGRKVQSIALHRHELRHRPDGP